VKRQLAARRKVMKAKLAERRRVVNDKSRPRRRLLVALLLLLLLLLFKDCSCETPEPGAGPAPEPAVGEPEPQEPGELVIAPGRIGRKGRPTYRTDAPDALPWLAAFRMQVAARSPRLAGCFVGIEQPGALRWTTSVEPVSGQVSEHDLEPTLASVELTRKQRDCVVGVLAEPVYRLEGEGERSTPSRVGMVIEF
jgi:hypothetical protein